MGYNFNNGTAYCDKCGEDMGDLSIYDYIINKHNSHKFLCDKCNGKVIDNSEQILKHLSWNDPHEFYFIQIIQRKKDNNTNVGKGNNGSRNIKSYYIFSEQQFRDKFTKIKEICEDTNSRAYIHMNKRHSEDCSLTAIHDLADYIRKDITTKSYHIWDHSVGNTPMKEDYWMIDFDSKDNDELNKVLEIVETCRGNHPRIKLIIPTKNGYHVMTGRFDRNQFAQELAVKGINKLDVYTDNPTLLYFKQTK